MSERSLFIAALEMDDPAKRAAYLDQACAGNAPLRQRLERLLKAHDQPDSFLEAPAPNLGATVDEPPITEKPGTVIGPYKLLEQIGEGGMGLVFVAEQQQPVRRKVALKIIKPGMDSAQVIARFEAERQALALMDHQNIAKVFDAGTTESGRPYFVMELVHGIPITQYCDANQFTPHQRLELFVPVCQAIQHAHQKGIIHRDIKPSNILVTMYDDKPVPKVIDFGVAKAIEQRLTEKTIYTQFGTLVGTFEYMSPEQAEMNAFGVDTRSDIYALGVLLYELLTGTTPLERPRLREAALGEIVRLIKEEEPPRPSVRLSTSGALAKVAAARKTDPAKLSRLVRGELDWVVMRCLEKDRTRRYDTASMLARDVERYLKDEPVEARPPSAWYRFRKLARRNKAALTTAALVAAALVLGTGISTWQAIRATAAEHVARDDRDRAVSAEQQAGMDRDRALLAERQANAEKANAQAALDFIHNDILMLVSPEREADPDIKLRTVIDRIAERLDREPVKAPLLEASLRYTVGRVYQDLGLRKEARDNLQKSLALYHHELGEEHPDTLRSMVPVAGFMRYSDPQEAGRLLKRALELRRRVSGDDNFWTLQAMRQLAWWHDDRGDVKEAERLLVEFLEGCRRTLGDKDQWTATAMQELGSHYLKVGNDQKAEALIQQALALRHKLVDKGHFIAMYTEGLLADVYNQQGRYAEAEPILRRQFEAFTRQLGDNHLRTLFVRGILAYALGRLGEHEQAVALSQASIEQMGKLRANEDVERITLPGTLVVLGHSLNRLKRYEEAEPPLREALAIREKSPLAGNPRLLNAKSTLGETLMGLKRYDDAKGLLLEAYHGLRKPSEDGWSEGMRPGYLTDTLERLVQLYDAWDKPDEAAQWRKELETRKVAEQKP